MKFPFGKFNGKDISELPTSYIEWCLTNLVLADYLQTELENQLKLRSGEGIVRDAKYVKEHGIKFEDDK